MDTNESTASDTATQGTAESVAANDGQETKPAAETTPPEMTVEDYKAALAKARKEAAKYRTERNELRPLADKARQLEEASKTELERAQERIAALEAEKQASELAALRAQVASKHGLPVDVIAGDDEEAMEASAAAIAAVVEKRLTENNQPRLPYVQAVGREGTEDDRDATARAILGL